MSLLHITNLQAGTADTTILKGINLAVDTGEIVALVGPNGSGKSTLASVLMGHPDYAITAGDVVFNNHHLLTLPPEERARLGLFLSFQYPHDIPGVTLGHFLQLAYNCLHTPTLNLKDFLAHLKAKLALLNMSEDFITRSLNEGFSGGEKKRAEILQLAVLEPSFAILDESDSGLDSDAVKVVGKALTTLKQHNPALTLFIITHHHRLLGHVVPHRVLVMRHGQIMADGSLDLLSTIDQHGYDYFSSRVRV